MTQENKVLLNAKQFEEIAMTQSDVLNDLQLIQNLIYYMPETGNFKIDEQLNLIHSKLQQVAKTLDTTTGILYSTTEKRELKEFGVKAGGDN